MDEQHFKLENLQTVHFFNYHIDDFASDFILSKCKTTLETLKLSYVSMSLNNGKEGDVLMPNLKKLTIVQKNRGLSWTLSRFLQRICPNITELNLVKAEPCLPT